MICNRCIPNYYFIVASDEEIKKLQQQRKLESGQLAGFGTAVSGFDDDIYGDGVAKSKLKRTAEVYDDDYDDNRMEVEDQGRYGKASHPSTLASYSKDKELVSLYFL